MCSTEITMKKPIYVGLAVLHLSETLMHDFHYSFEDSKSAVSIESFIFILTQAGLWHSRCFAVLLLHIAPPTIR